MRSSSWPGAGARPAQDPGVTPATVALGGTVPLTGEAAAFGSVGAGAKAYFDYVNETTRVHGRRISYTFYDDAYNPAQTVQLTRKLVEEDKVFAVFNTVGTSNSLAVRDYLNARKVPQLFAADGSQAIGRSFVRYPWTMGFLMSYRGEGDVYGTNIAQTRPRARIAVLYENTELGRDMLAGLTRAVAGKGPKIVAKESYEFTGSDVTGQIAKLKASRADTLMLFATPKFFIQAAVSAHKLALEAASVHRVRLDRAGDHGDRPHERAGADEGRALDRVREEPERPGVEEGQDGCPLQDDHAPVQPIKGA